MNDNLIIILPEVETEAQCGHAFVKVTFEIRSDWLLIPLLCL